MRTWFGPPTMSRTNIRVRLKLRSLSPLSAPPERMATSLSGTITAALASPSRVKGGLSLRILPLEVDLHVEVLIRLRGVATWITRVPEALAVGGPGEASARRRILHARDGPI